MVSSRTASPCISITTMGVCIVAVAYISRSYAIPRCAGWGEVGKKEIVSRILGSISLVFYCSFYRDCRFDHIYFIILNCNDKAVIADEFNNIKASGLVFLSTSGF